RQRTHTPFPTRRSSDLGDDGKRLERRRGQLETALRLTQLADPRVVRVEGEQLETASDLLEPERAPGVDVLVLELLDRLAHVVDGDRKSTRLNSSHVKIS